MGGGRLYKALAKRSRLFTIQRSTCMLSEMETSIGSSLLKEFCGGKVPTGIKQ